MSRAITNTIEQNPLPINGCKTKGEWSHLTGVYADGTQKFYVDGELVGEKDAALVGEKDAALSINPGVKELGKLAITWGQLKTRLNLHQIRTVVPEENGKPQSDSQM